MSSERRHRGRSNFVRVIAREGRRTLAFVRRRTDVDGAHRAGDHGDHPREEHAPSKVEGRCCALRPDARRAGIHVLHRLRPDVLRRWHGGAVRLLRPDASVHRDALLIQVLATAGAPPAGGLNLQHRQLATEG